MLNEDHAKAIIKAIIGFDVDDGNPKTLGIAWEVGNNLIAAVQALDPSYRDNEIGE